MSTTTDAKLQQISLKTRTVDVNVQFNILQAQGIDLGFLPLLQAQTRYIFTIH